MTTRFNVNSQKKFGVDGINGGYTSTSSTDLFIPPVGLEDVDRALFTLFDKEMTIQVDTKGKGLTKVPVRFAGGEKWALSKKKNMIVDRNGTVILPIISISRTSIKQNKDSDITGRGINQQTGEIVIHRRLSARDRNYQKLINRLLLKNQQNVAAKSGSEQDWQVSTNREVGELKNDPIVQSGGLLLNDRRNNVFETIVVPSPQFYSVTYEITIWTQYIQHTNSIIQYLMSSYLPQGNCWRLVTPAGYWFVATPEDLTFNLDSNVEDMSSEERYFKTTFAVNVPAYVFVSPTPGQPIPLKRYVSVPTVKFSVSSEPIDGTDPALTSDVFLGADDPTLPLSDGTERRRDQRNTGSTTLYPNKASVSPHDPALSTKKRGKRQNTYKKIIGVDSTGKRVVDYVKVVSTNTHSGETVYSGDFLLGHGSEFSDE